MNAASMNELIIIIAGHRPVMCYSLVNRNEKNPFKIYASASSSGSPPQSVDLFVVSHTSHPALKKIIEIHRQLFSSHPV